MLGYNIVPENASAPAGYCSYCADECDNANGQITSEIYLLCIKKQLIFSLRVLLKQTFVLSVPPVITYVVTQERLSTKVTFYKLVGWRQWTSVRYKFQTACSSLVRDVTFIFTASLRHPITDWWEIYEFQNQLHQTAMILGHWIYGLVWKRKFIMRKVWIILTNRNRNEVVNILLVRYIIFKVKVENVFVITVRCGREYLAQNLDQTDISRVIFLILQRYLSR